MLYVAKFAPDQTKSFTQVSYHYLKALQTQNINFEVRPLDCMINWSEAPEWVRSSKEYFTNTRSELDVALIHALPMDLPKCFYKSKDKAIGITAFETTAIPAWLSEALNATYRGLIVPSEYNKKALLESGITIPVEVVPHALAPMWLQDLEPPKDKSDTYIFGYVGNWNARKNPQVLLDSYLKAFPTPSESQALILKTFGKPGIEEYITTNYGERPDIWVYNESWEEETVLWAFSLMDCYVSCHKGEAFGLTLAQAMTLGKPVIYTDFSAPQEYLDDDSHFPIPCSVRNVQEEEITTGYSHINQNLQWADIDEEKLIEVMQQLVKTKQTKGYSGDRLEHFRELYSWQSIGQTMVKAVESIMQKPLARKED